MPCERSGAEKGCPVASLVASAGPGGTHVEPRAQEQGTPQAHMAADAATEVLDCLDLAGAVASLDAGDEAENRLDDELGVET